MAFGPLNLLPDQFWAMTPKEFFLLVDGYKLRQEHTMHITAWHACNLMNIHLKKKVTIKKLLGQEKQMTPFDREKALQKLNEMFAQIREE